MITDLSFMNNPDFKTFKINKIYCSYLINNMSYIQNNLYLRGIDELR